MKAVIQKLLLLDNNLTTRLRMQPGKNGLWYLMAISAHSGDPWYWLIGFAILWWLSDHPWKQRAVFFFISIFILGMVITVLKYIFHRSRPAGNWGNIYRIADPHSFPSGHAARSAMLVVLGFGLGPTWLAIALLIHAPLVILSRVATGVHYFSDVIAGAAIGVLFGWFMLLLQPLILTTLDHLLSLII